MFVLSCLHCLVWFHWIFFNCFLVGFQSAYCSEYSTEYGVGETNTWGDHFCFLSLEILIDFTKLHRRTGVQTNNRTRSSTENLDWNQAKQNAERKKFHGKLVILGWSILSICWGSRIQYYRICLYNLSNGILWTDNIFLLHNAQNES